MSNVSSLTFESPFVRGVQALAVGETSDGKGVLFRCPSTGREFVVTYDAMIAAAPAAPPAPSGQ